MPESRITKMNIALWVLQVLLALHTAMGAVWKLSNSEQTVPSLSALPHGVWLSLSIVELLCCLALVVPGFHHPWAILVPIAAACIAAEMFLFCGVHLASGQAKHGEMFYWLVVAALSGFIACGRFVLKPL
jgi:xanthine/uracil/vitamin C permease (AzgA family)